MWYIFQLSNRLSETHTLIEDLEALKDELYPLARRAAMLYSIIRSLQSIHNEYQFSLAYFVSLFDEAVGGELPAEFLQKSQLDDVSQQWLIQNVGWKQFYFVSVFCWSMFMLSYSHSSQKTSLEMIKNGDDCERISPTRYRLS